MTKEQNPLIARLRDPKLIGHEGLREEAALEIELLQDRESRLRATDLREALRGVCEHSARGSVAYQIAAGALADSPAEPRVKPDDKCGNCGDDYQRHLGERLFCPDAVMPDIYRWTAEGSPANREVKP